MNPDGHLTPAEAKAFVQSPPVPGTLTPAGRLAVSDHLAACAECRSLVVAARVPSDEGNRALRAEIQSLTDAAQTEAAREKDDLQAFARSVATFPAAHFEPGSTLKPAPSAGHAKENDHATTPVGWWTAFFSQPTFATVGFAVAAVAVTLGVVTLIHRGTTIQPSAQIARAKPLLTDGPVVVAADGSLQTNMNLPADLRTAISETIRQSALRLHGGMLGTMRGEAGAVSPYSNPATMSPYPVTPAPGSTVESRRPELQWTSVPGATGYQVEIKSPSTGDQSRSLSLPASQTRWQPELPLERGRIYRWRVQTTGASAKETTMSASLKILGADDEETLRQLRAAPKVSHLALAVACARFDLVEEARQELEILSAKHPESTLVAQLRASLK